MGGAVGRAMGALVVLSDCIGCTVNWARTCHPAFQLVDRLPSPTSMFLPLRTAPHARTHVHACARMCTHVNACARMCTHVHARANARLQGRSHSQHCCLRSLQHCANKASGSELCSLQHYARAHARNTCVRTLSPHRRDAHCGALRRSCAAATLTWTYSRA